jgi:uncharacterized protein
VTHRPGRLEPWEVDDLPERLETLVRSTPWLLEALRAARDVDPPDWLVGGGVLRNLVWDRLAGWSRPTPPRDVDLAFFDPTRLDPARDAATWPETATAVAVHLHADDRLEIVAPCGLEDLFGLVCRRNPRRVTVDHYRRRIRDKRIAERWPRVEIVL